MKIRMVFFSATGVTESVARVIRDRFADLGAEVVCSDITPVESRKEQMTLDGYDAFVIGAPIHSNRAPRVVREWLGGLAGGGRKAAMFFTYGGFSVHPTHHSTREILAASGFSVVSSAEFLGKHTFNLGGWAAMADRPNDDDFAVARLFAEKTYRRFTGEDPGVLGDLEKTAHSEEALDNFELFRFAAVTQLPTRDGMECSMCMKCGDVCPTGAMDVQKGEADRQRCIVCLGCVAACPEGILRINDLRALWPMKLQGEGETEESLNMKVSKVYL
ncbi:MAG: 4Fe-4S ferredoxin [Deltaproteobacteria bacterium]|nr:4Fe-4S ferredoxin [Candidatus Zymogenaceae bacterium]